MKRYTALLAVICLCLAAFFVGRTELADADDNDKNKTTATITVYSTLPPEHAAVLAAAYENSRHVKVNFELLAPDKLFERLVKEKSAPKAEAVLAGRAVLEKAAANGIFHEIVSEETEIVAPPFHGENNSWVGVWYDPIVFGINNDFIQKKQRLPLSYDELGENTAVKIALTDFLAADAAGNLLFSLVEEFGEQKAFLILKRIHPQVVQYARYLSTPVRMAGMGEVDLSIAVQSESLRYIGEGYPIKLIYPSDGTAYLLTGIGMLKGAEEGHEAREFADWLLSDEAQLALRSNRFYFVSTNPSSLASMSFAGKNLVLFESVPEFDEKEQRTLLDKWVKEIRLK